MLLGLQIRHNFGEGNAQVDVLEVTRLLEPTKLQGMGGARPGSLTAARARGGTARSHGILQPGDAAPAAHLAKLPDACQRVHLCASKITLLGTHTVRAADLEEGLQRDARVALRGCKTVAVGPGPLSVRGSPNGSFRGTGAWGLTAVLRGSASSRAVLGRLPSVTSPAGRNNDNATKDPLNKPVTRHSHGETEDEDLFYPLHVALLLPVLRRRGCFGPHNPHGKNDTGTQERATEEIADALRLALPRGAYTRTPRPTHRATPHHPHAPRVAERAHPRAPCLARPRGRRSPARREGTPDPAAPRPRRRASSVIRARVQCGCTGGTWVHRGGKSAHMEARRTASGYLRVDARARVGAYQVV